MIIILEIEQLHTESAMDENVTRSQGTVKVVTKMSETSMFNRHMTILLLQVISMIAVFLVTLAGALLPAKVIGFKNTASISRHQHSAKVLSYCNCLAGGVFLATCFLGLIPNARGKFQEILDKKDIKTEYPFCEAVVILGFFLILCFEQLALSLQKQWQNNSKRNEIQMKKVSLKFNAADGKVKIDTSVDEDEDEDQDIFNRESDTQPMLASSRNGGHHRVNATHDDDIESEGHAHHVDSHGHSHLGNINDSGMLRSIILLFALSTHSVFEGMALGLQEDVKSIVYLLIAMLAHESLAAFALGASLLKNAIGSTALLIYGVVFAGMIPAGIALGLLIRTSPGFGSIVCSAIMQAIAAGIFIFVTFFEILKHEFEVLNDRPQKIALAVLGYLVLAGLEAVG